MNETKKLKGRDLITIGIFSALYFIPNLAEMITGFVPMLRLLLPGVAGILTGIPFMLMESKVACPPIRVPLIMKSGSCRTALTCLTASTGV